MKKLGKKADFIEMTIEAYGKCDCYNTCFSSCYGACSSSTNSRVSTINTVYNSLSYSAARKAK